MTILVVSIAFFLVVAEGEEDWGADERILLADFAFEETLIRPVQEAEIATVDDEPGRASVGLDDVFELRTGVFEAGGDVFDDGFTEDFVEFGSFEFEVTSCVDFSGEFEKFGDVLTGFGTGDENGRIRQEVEIAFEFVKDMVGVVDEVGFGENDDNSLAGVNDLASEGLVEFGMGLGCVDKEGANIGFFNGGESAEGGEFFDADFAFAGFAKAGGVENFEGAVVEANFDAVDIAGSSLAGADERLLFLAEGVKKTGFADVWATDEGNLKWFWT